MKNLATILAAAAIALCSSAFAEEKMEAGKMDKMGKMEKMEGGKMEHADHGTSAGAHKKHKKDKMGKIDKMEGDKMEGGKMDKKAPESTDKM